MGKASFAEDVTDLSDQPDLEPKPGFPKFDAVPKTSTRDPPFSEILTLAIVRAFLPLYYLSEVFVFGNGVTVRVVTWFNPRLLINLLMYAPRTCSRYGIKV